MTCVKGRRRPKRPDACACCLGCWPPTECAAFSPPSIESRPAPGEGIATAPLLLTAKTPNPVQTQSKKTGAQKFGARAAVYPSSCSVGPSPWGAGALSCSYCCWPLQWPCCSGQPKVKLLDDCRWLRRRFGSSVMTAALMIGPLSPWPDASPRDRLRTPHTTVSKPNNQASRPHHHRHAPRDRRLFSPPRRPHGCRNASPSSPPPPRHGCMPRRRTMAPPPQEQQEEPPQRRLPPSCAGTASSTTSPRRTTTAPAATTPSPTPGTPSGKGTGPPTPTGWVCCLFVFLGGGLLFGGLRASLLFAY